MPSSSAAGTATAIVRGGSGSGKACAATRSTCRHYRKLTSLFLSRFKCLIDLSSQNARKPRLYSNAKRYTVELAVETRHRKEEALLLAVQFVVEEIARETGSCRRFPAGPAHTARDLTADPAAPEWHATPGGSPYFDDLHSESHGAVQRIHAVATQRAPGLELRQLRQRRVISSTRSRSQELAV